MKDYYKEKLKVDLDLLRMYNSIIVVLSAGLATLILRERFGEKNTDYALFIIGCGFLIFLAILSIQSYIHIRKDLGELKKQ